jgi:hypothetical protein
MADKNVGWLVPARAPNPAGTVTQNMKDFQTALDAAYHTDTNNHVLFPNPQFLNGDNANLDGCVQALLSANNPAFDAFAVAGSTGVRALADAQAGLANKRPIIQVVGGHPVPPEYNTFTTGYHINARKVASDQVGKLHGKFGSTTQITVLMDYTSETAAHAFNAIVSAVKTLNANQHLNIQVRQPLLVGNAADVHALTQLAASPVVGCLMLTPSGMFYDSATMQDIVQLVENAGANAIYPEKEFKDAHTAGYTGHVKIYGHNINKTYKKVDLANQLLQNNVQPGQEAPDMDDI